MDMNDIGSCFNEMVTSAIILHPGDDRNTTYFIPGQANDTILASETQESSEEEVSSFNNFLMLEESTVNKTQKIADETQDILFNKSGKSSGSSISDNIGFSFGRNRGKFLVTDRTNILFWMFSKIELHI